MSGRLAGKTALITAAGQGIGHATAMAMAREGAWVFATDVKPELLEGGGVGPDPSERERDLTALPERVDTEPAHALQREPGVGLVARQDAGHPQPVPLSGPPDQVRQQQVAEPGQSWRAAAAEYAQLTAVGRDERLSLAGIRVVEAQHGPSLGSGRQRHVAVSLQAAGPCCSVTARGWLAVLQCDCTWLGGCVAV